MNDFQQYIELVKGDLHRISKLIHANPEVAFQEKESSELLISFLEQHGFSAERNFKEMETAFKVTKNVCGGGLSVLFISEYDALPGLGHACGHNLIAVSGLAAFLSAVRYAEDHQISATFTLIGTPAEETYGGKTILRKRGAFDGYDVCFLLHPFAGTATDPGWLSSVKIRVKFTGRASHAASRPEDGLNALDAAVLLYNSVAMWRQQLPERSRIHGIFTNGGTAPNIIPDKSEMFWNLRAPELKRANEMLERFHKMVQGAADSTGTTAEEEIVAVYEPSVFNEPLNTLYGDLWKEMFGVEIFRGNGTEGRASSDFGDVSVLIPGANYLYDITQGADHPLHTPEFREDASGDYAFENTMRASAVTAAAALRFLTVPEFREKVHADWKRQIE
ncbi:MAG: M20 family metallopeptidase [Lentisphaeria bacterium]|nr:M20 family metallopeptidase [Lentisphaeria bacterium]